MRVLRVEGPFGTVSLYGERLHSGHDFKVLANAPASDAEILLFLDSRGVSEQWHGSLLQRIVDHLGARPYLALSRPLLMTTWATLYNFMTLNDVAPSLIVTNLGFVDCTPKKPELCEDVLSQIRYRLPATTCRLQRLDRYMLSSGRVEDLYSIDYSDDYRSALNALVRQYETVAIKSPLVSPAIPFPRARPSSFFTQLVEGNRLLDAIGCHTIELGEFDPTLTYDAVHWTPKANEFIFDKLRPYL
jgi:hypothetical protein